MSRYLIITPDWQYEETKVPPNHDHWLYDEKTDIYYEASPFNYFTSSMNNTLNNYGIKKG